MSPSGRRWCLVVAPWLAWGGPALACSGPGASDLMVRAELIALASLVVVVLFVLGATWVGRLRKVARGPVAGGWVLVLAHPWIWLSARSGDCGLALQQGAVLFSAASVALLAYVLWRPAGDEALRGSAE